MEYHDANVDLSPRSSRDQQQVGKDEFLALLIGSHLNLPSPSASAERIIQAKYCWTDRLSDMEK